MRVGRAALAAITSIASATLAAWLALHHPLSPTLALAVVAAAAVAAAWRPVWWPAWLLPLLPLVGLMPWTGWLVVEELDLLLLAVAAGGYARWGLGHVIRAGEPSAPAQRLSMAVWWLLPLMLSTAVACWRGVVDAGGLSWGWWQGYREPLNSLRLLKPLVLVLGLLPLVAQALRHEPEQARRALTVGMLGLLATVALGVWWERWAYTGLLDFSSDYRATGLFWEMHVGGAALDAALALAVPFAVLTVWQARRPWVVAAGLVVLGLGAYAALATFSRVVYVGLPVGLAVVLWLRQRELDRAGRVGDAAAPGGLGPAAVWVVAVALLAAWLFPAGGYRGLLALLAATALVLAVAEPTRPLPARVWGRGLLAGGVVALGVALAAAFVPKGAYLAFAGAWLAAVALLWAGHRRRGPAGAGLIAATVAVLAGVVAVPVHWGGGAAWAPALVAALLLTLGWFGAAGRRRPSWPGTGRWLGQTMALMVVVAGVVGVFGGGNYMSQRFASTGDDTGGRHHHWAQALELLRADGWLFGQGLGRFLGNFTLSGRVQDQVGDYRVLPSTGASGTSGPALVLTAGKHLQGWGEMFRVSQRIALPAPGPLRVALNVRAPEATDLHVEVCEKQLLYDRNCREQTAQVRPGPGWQRLELTLAGEPLSRGAVLAPRWIVFSVALASPGRRAEIDDLALVDAAGRPLLANGGFDEGMARWFFTSDKHHMPWHAKNAAVHLLFEQGWFGLLAAALAAGVALWRTSVGAARGHPLAPALAAALVAVSVVGIGDSLFDMPRIAWLLWWLVAVALLLPGARPGRRP